MGLRKLCNQAELQTLSGALADEDGNIPWLAAAPLTQLGGLPVVRLLGAFLQTNPPQAARVEAVKVLQMIGGMSEDETVR